MIDDNRWAHLSPETLELMERTLQMAREYGAAQRSLIDSISDPVLREKIRKEMKEFP